MTEKQPSTSTLSCSEAPDGTRLFFWDGGARLEVSPHPDSLGRWHVAAFQHDTPLTAARLRVSSLQDRRELAQHCDPSDPTGQQTWLTRLVEVAMALDPLTTQAEERTVDVRQLSTVNPERVEWLWHPLLPRGRPVSLEGNPGIGKSNVVLKIAAHLTTGTPFPTVLEGMFPQKASAPRTVCLLASEDDAGDTLRPRLEVNGGDATRLYLVEGWTAEGGRHGTVTLQDIRVLEQALKQYEPALLVVDPFQAFFGRSIDMNHANETRPVLADMAALGKAYGCTIIYVRHLGKTAREHAIYAAIGSIDISAHVRSAILVGVDPEEPTRRILAHHKASNAPEAQSLAFRLRETEREMFRADGSSVMVAASRVDWDGLSDLTAVDLIQPKRKDEGGNGEAHSERQSALTKAQDFLRELLNDGPVLSTEVQKAAREAGVELRTLRRAQATMDIAVTRRKEEGTPSNERPWVWHLLDGQEDLPPCHSNDGHLGI